MPSFSSYADRELAASRQATVTQEQEQAGLRVGETHEEILPTAYVGNGCEVEENDRK